MRRFSLIFFFACTLIATIFFDDPHLYFYKRIIYVIFGVLSVYQLYLFNYKRPEGVLDLPTPRWHKIWMQLFVVFILIGLFKDVRNPTFSLITILNHPLAVLAVIPVFAFQIGFQTVNIDKFVKFLLVACCLFCLLFAFPIQSQNIYAASGACCYAVLPLALFSMDRKKYGIFIVLLIAMSIWFSQVSDSRTIVLRLLIFFGLLIGMRLVKKWSPLKFLVIVAACFMIYQFLVNLQDWLDFFKSFIHIKNFDDDDTRTFLYEEVFADMKPYEWILGRGFLGTYFSPYFLWLQTNNNDFTGDHYYRFAVEVGFLQLLFKGGLAYFLLYITPLVAVIYRGLFTRHNSRIAFYISVYILCELLIMFIENIPSYHLQFFIIFFLAGYGYRQTVLEAKTATNEDLYYNTLLQPGTVH
jgi:hypothetical protein